MIAKYNLNLNEDMIYLIETLKVEGYWSRKNYSLTLQNKNMPLLNHIEEILKKRGLIIPSKRILLKIKLEDETKKEDIKILEDKKELSFHIEISPFDNKKVKAVTNQAYKKKYELELIYKNEIYPIKIQCLKNKIDYQSKLKCFIYEDLRFPKIELLKFLDKYCGDKKSFHVEEFLFNANEKIVISAFSALIDCEGTINWYGFKRNIQIRMRNKIYLEQWHELLNKHEIGNKFKKNKKEWEINISGWQDFNKLQTRGFKLYHSEKADKFKRIMSNFKRNQISRGGYKKFYTEKLKEINKPVTSEDFAKFLNKSKRTTNHYLLKLEKEKIIECNRKKWPYLYFISTSSVR